MTTNLTILLILILLSAFFSASEIAFVSLTDAKVKSMVDRKLPRAKIIEKLTHNSRRLLITILIGTNIVNIAATSLATLITDSVFHSAVLAITTAVMTLVTLVVCELIPKSYAASHPKQYAIFAARYLQIFSFIIYPVVLIFERLTNAVAGESIRERISEEELKAMAGVSVEQGAIESGEAKMIERLFAFNDITAEDIMTPRVDVTAIRDTLTNAEAVEIFRTNGHTRFPVIHETPDDIIGFVHTRDVLLAASTNPATPITSTLHPILHVPRQLPIDELLKEFQKKQTHIAAVMDEHGGTSGIVTLEDVLEELVGEIADEHDVEEELIKRLDKDTIMVSGDVEIRQINEFLNIRLPGDPLDTIAEIINETTQKVPRRGMEVIFGDVKCTVDSTKKKVIETVIIRKNQNVV